MNYTIKNAREMRPVLLEQRGLRPTPATKDPQAAVEDARAELAAAEAALADKTAREALADRIDADCKLAGATTELLHEVARLRVHGMGAPSHSTILAKYRKKRAVAGGILRGTNCARRRQDGCHASAGMSGAVVTLRGIRVRVVQDGDMDATTSCAACVFNGSIGGCPPAAEERAAGIQPCYHDDGHHYIEEEEDAQA